MPRIATPAINSSSLAYLVQLITSVRPVVVIIT